MSFDNNYYPNRKDNRRTYKYDTAKSVDRSCRNHGGDPYSEGNRLIKTIKTELIAKNELATFDLNEDVLMEGIGGA